jgi:chemotaxis protein methyltransferase CheR
VLERLPVNDGRAEPLPVALEETSVEPSLARVLLDLGGHDVSRYDEAFLRSVMAKRQADTGLLSDETYIARLAADDAERQTFFAELRITFSEFFRNPLTFALLEQQILPVLADTHSGDGSRELRVWSAGCAAGQEPYSVAILLEELALARGRPLPYRIFATDLSTLELDAARRGVYALRAVQNVRMKHLERYFTAHDEEYRIAPRLASRVHYSVYDLLDEQRPSPPAGLFGDFHVILCCNVLFYFRSAMRHRILDRLCASLAPGGYLITGEAERDSVASHAGLSAVAAPCAVFQYRSAP